jgi:hypothetical protein
MLAMATLQVGLLVKDQLILQGAARAGAREAAVSTDDAAVRQAAIDAAPGLDEAALDVSIARSGGQGGPATITVAYRAPIVIAVVRWLFPDTVDLSATATMRQETA